MNFKKLNKLSISSTGSNSKAQHIFLHEMSKAEKTHHMKDKFKGFQGDSFSFSFQAIFCSVFLTLSLFNSPAGVLKNQPQMAQVESQATLNTSYFGRKRLGRITVQFGVKNVWIGGSLKDMFARPSKVKFAVSKSTRDKLRCSTVWNKHIPSDGKDPVPPRIYKTH